MSQKEKSLTTNNIKEKSDEQGKGYKKTPIGDIPVEWDVVVLDDITRELHRYPTYYNIEYVERGIDNNVPEIRGELINRNGELDSDLNKYRYISSDTSKKFSRTILIEDDFVMSVRGTIGKIAIVNKSFEGANITANLIRISPDRSKINPKFMKQILISRRFQNYLDNLSSMTTIKTIQVPLLKSMNLALPSLPEQQIIAEILSTTDQAIQKSDEIINKTERFKKGMIHQLLTKGIGHDSFKETAIGEIPKVWNLKQIKDIFKVKTGTTPSTKNLEYWENGNIIWITPADMSRRESVEISNSKRKVTIKALKGTNLSIIPKNSIIISTRAPVGYVALTSHESTFNQGCKGLIPKNRDDVDALFFYYYLLSKHNRLQHLSGGSTFKELSKDTLMKIYVPIPSLLEQQNIAKILSNIDYKLDNENKRKEKLERIKTGLMNDLLIGKKRVKICN